MKKNFRKIICVTLFIAIFMLTACKSRKVVKPQFAGFKLDKLEDGVYNVEFNKGDIVDDKYINMKIYSEDLYDTLELHELKVGDSIEIGGQQVKVEKIVWDDQKTKMCLNYWDNIEDAEEIFVPIGGGVYTILGPDNHHTYTLRGTSKVILSPNIKYEDSSNLEVQPLKIQGIQEVFDYLKNSDSYYINLNTIMEMFNGECAMINRRYIP